MTLTETPGGVTAPAAAPLAASGVSRWPATADHKQIGLTYVFFAFLFLLAGLVVGELLRIEQALPTRDVLGHNVLRAVSTHATVTGLLFLGPLWLGISTYMVPLQIGASRLALPRLHAFALWLFVVGGGIVVASYIVGPPRAPGLASAVPMAAQGPANQATTMWVTGLILVTLGTLLAALDLAITVLLFRTDGLSFARLPMFTFATFATAVAALLSTPVFLGGLVLLYLDQHLGGSFFASSNPGGQVVWQHTLWLFGRPEIYLLTLPALGAACDIVATHSRKPLLSGPAARTAICLFAFLSFGAWAAGSEARHAVVLPTYSMLTALIGVPVGLLVLVWLGSVAKGRPHFHISLVFVGGFVALLAIAAANAVIAAAVGLRPDRQPGSWAAANIHLVAFAAPTLLAIAALYHWAPKLWGRALSAGVGGLVFLFTFVGFVIEGVAGYVHGFRGTSSTGTSGVGSVGGVLVLLGILMLVADMVRAGRGRGETAPEDPYEGLTLEWATASPPPLHNFEWVPEVRSDAPLLDLRGGV